MDVKELLHMDVTREKDLVVGELDNGFRSAGERKGRGSRTLASVGGKGRDGSGRAKMGRKGKGRARDEGGQVTRLQVREEGGVGKEGGRGGKIRTWWWSSWTTLQVRGEVGGQGAGKRGEL